MTKEDWYKLSFPILILVAVGMAYLGGLWWGESHTEADQKAIMDSCPEDSVWIRWSVPGPWQCVALDDLP